MGKLGLVGGMGPESTLNLTCWCQILYIILEIIRKKLLFSITGGSIIQGYENKNALIHEIEKTASLFVKEFVNIDEKDKSKMIDGVGRTPSQIISYQLGWLDLIRKWDKDEADGKVVVTLASGYKWNNLAGFTKVFILSILSTLY